MYNADDVISSTMPTRTLRLAFKYGINTIDTSPYYYPSEFVLGRALASLAPEHPRKSYYLCTKAGRYGPNVSEFDYSPEKITSSVEASLKRLRTTYLDLVYLHDAEFVAEKVGKGQDDGFEAHLATQDTAEGERVRQSLGLDPQDAGKIHGPGDETFLAAVRALFALKEQGKIRNVGISGYPLPALLRLSRLVAAREGQPLDAILSYSNHTLHSDILPAYLSLFETPKPLILNGSPFSMGLLTDNGPPEWHPASTQLKDACVKSAKDLAAFDTTLAQVALTYGIRGAEQKQNPLRTLLGMSSVEHVHAAMQAFRVLQNPASDAYGKQVGYEEVVKRNVAESGMDNWSWASPPLDAYQ